MKRFFTTSTIVLVAGVLAASPALAKRGYAKVKGEVIRVEQQVRTENQGEFDRLTIRTRSGQELRLNLGPGGACEACYLAGDRVRARVRTEAADGSGREVQSIRVRRGGTMYSFNRQGGRLVPGRGHGPGGALRGDRIHDRDRRHDPSSAGSRRQAQGGGGRRGGGC